jgi:hypothetical protein
MMSLQGQEDTENELVLATSNNALPRMRAAQISVLISFARLCFARFSFLTFGTGRSRRL